SSSSSARRAKSTGTSSVSSPHGDDQGDLCSASSREATSVLPPNIRVSSVYGKQGKGVRPARPPMRDRDSVYQQVTNSNPPSGIVNSILRNINLLRVRYRPPMSHVTPSLHIARSTFFVVNLFWLVKLAQSALFNIARRPPGHFHGGVGS